MATKKVKAAAKKARREEKLAKAPAPDRLVAALRAKFSPDAALLMREGGYAKVREVCPTGIDVLDRHVIGIGGLPYGRLTELEGVEGTGKTTILSKFMAAAQRDGAVVSFADKEHKFSAEWAAVHGVDAGAVVQLQPETLEDFHEQAMFILDQPGKRRDMICLDSIANISTRLELAEGTDIPAEHARQWAKFLRPFTQKVAQRQALVVFVNQPRSKIGVLYGPTESTFGGRALKHAYSLRLQVNHGKSIKDGDVHVGRYMNVMAEKNQLAPPFRKAQLRLVYSEGFDDDWATLSHAKDVGCIAKDATFIPKNVREARANLGWPAAGEEIPAEEAGA